MLYFYLYDTDNERLVGTFEACNWEEALAIQNRYFGHLECGMTLRLTPHEWWD
jgi:hypothetical protein